MRHFCLLQLKTHRECPIGEFMNRSVSVTTTPIKFKWTVDERVKKMLEQHPDIDSSTKPLMVNFNQFGPSSLDFFIYCFTSTTVWTEYHVVKEDVVVESLQSDY